MLSGRRFSSAEKCQFSQTAICVKKKAASQQWGTGFGTPLSMSHERDSSDPGVSLREILDFPNHTQHPQKPPNNGELGAGNRCAILLARRPLYKCPPREYQYAEFINFS